MPALKTLPVLALAAPLLFVASPAHAASPDVVISQAYGGGGNSGSYFTNDFIELYNRGTDPVDVGGWALQYGAAGSTGNLGGSSSFETVLPAGTTIAAGSYFLIQEAAGTGGTQALPTPDATGSIAMGSTGFQLALTTTSAQVNSPTAPTVRDFLGAGAASRYEGSGPAPTISNTTSDSRKDPRVDTDDNSADFAAGSPQPHNSTGTTSAPPSTACSTSGTAGLTIEQIEGAAIDSPYAGQAVSCVPGIVTAVRGGGYYVQDPAGDGNLDTSDALYVYGGATPPIGASVRVSGTVAEYADGYSDDYQLNIREPELTGPTVTTVSTGNALPAPVVVGSQPGDELPPKENASSVNGDVEASGAPFNRTTDALDFWRSLDGMRVEIRDAKVVGPTVPAGSSMVVVPGGVDAGPATPSGGVLYDSYADPNTRRIEVFNQALGAALPNASVGDTATAANPVIGVIHFFGDPEIDVTQQPAFTSAGLQPQTTTLTAGSGQLSVATYNVENLNPQDPASKYSSLANQIVNNLKSPDLIAVEEVQDNNGTTDDGTVSASTTLSMLENAITAAGGPAYQATEIDPSNDADGGQPGGNIRQVFLYRDPVQLVSIPGGGSTTADSVVGTGAATTLAQSPGRIDPTNSAWNSSRKPLVAEFTLGAGGPAFFAVGNHFVAKLGDTPIFGRIQPPAQASEAQRVQQATAVNSFVQSLLSANPAANVVVLGDFNDYTFSQSQQTLRGSQLQDLFTKLPANQEYDYDYEGNSQTLDHVLVSGPLFGSAQFQPVHVNAEFANQTSDHDPEIAVLTPGAVTPPAALPEAPMTVLLVLLALPFGGALLLRRKRRAQLR